MLLHLPPELRNKIYHTTLTSPTPLTLTPRPRSALPPTALLLSCRQIHHEAAPLLYSGNTFHFLSRRAFHTLRYFVAQIGARNAAALRRVGLRWPGFRAEVVERALHGLLRGTSGAGVEVQFYYCCGVRGDGDGDGDAAALKWWEARAGLRLLGLMAAWPARVAFHAAPLAVWAGGGADDRCVLMLREMRRRGWEIRLYEADCLDPDAESSDWHDDGSLNLTIDFSDFLSYLGP